jgi:ACS family 4-hydroxyphenylacetate permease-like MFS transporter
VIGLEHEPQQGETAILERVSRRILWFLLVCFMINFVDRTNIGFAALTMNRDLRLSSTTFGIASGALSVAYAICEIPSNLMLERVGARRWLARIMVTWGLASAATAFAVGPRSLIAFRMLIGAAEAGFLPGILLYMTYWYPQFHRARAQSVFMIGQPIAMMCSALLSGFLLGLNGLLGLAGWQWLFVIEGTPAVLFGVVLYVWLPDRPEHAAFLSPAEKTILRQRLEQDEKDRERLQIGVGAPDDSVVRRLLSRQVILVSFAYACLVATLGTLALWTPQIVRNLASRSPLWVIGGLVAIPPGCSILSMMYWTRRSDEREERFWHCVSPMLGAIPGWLLAAYGDGLAVRLLGLTIASMVASAAWPVLFTLPSLILPPRARAAGIAFFSSIGMTSVALTAVVVGSVRDRTGGFTVPMWLMVGCLATGACTLRLVKGSLQRTNVTHRQS